jgi:hypothetical protein
MTVEQIAALLNKTQKWIMITAPIDGFWFPVCCEGWRWPWRSLSRLGLVYPREVGLQTFSPLGLAVRKHLEETL